MVSHFMKYVDFHDSAFGLEIAYSRPNFYVLGVNGVKCYKIEYSGHQNIPAAIDQVWWRCVQRLYLLVSRRDQERQ